MVCLESDYERSWSKLTETGPNSKMTKSLVVEVVRVTTEWPGWERNSCIPSNAYSTNFQKEIRKYVIMKQRPFPKLTSFSNLG